MPDQRWGWGEGGGLTCLGSSTVLLQVHPPVDMVIRDTEDLQEAEELSQGEQQHRDSPRAMLSYPSRKGSLLGSFTYGTDIAKGSCGLTGWHPAVKNDVFTLERIRAGHRLHNQKEECGYLIALASNGGKNQHFHSKKNTSIAVNMQIMRSKHRAGFGMQMCGLAAVFLDALSASNECSISDMVQMDAIRLRKETTDGVNKPACC